MIVFLELFCVLVLTGLDQLIKILVQNNLSPDGRIDVIKNALHIIYHENTGAAFGIFQEKTIYLGILSAIVVVIMIVVIAAKKIPNTVLQWCAVIGTAGAAGNMIDRIFRGYVIDYIYYSPINYPVFNLADILLTLCCVGIILYVLVTEIKDIEKKKAEKKAGNYTDIKENLNK